MFLFYHASIPSANGVCTSGLMFLFVLSAQESDEKTRPREVRSPGVYFAGEPRPVQVKPTDPLHVALRKRLAEYRVKPASPEVCHVDRG